MPVFIAAIGGMLINIVGHLAGRVLVGLGIAVITYEGMNITLNWLKDQAVRSFNGLPSEVFSLVSWLQVGTCISIITSAITVRLLITGIQGDTFKRWVLK